jgi:intron-binding protein aquarius
MPTVLPRLASGLALCARVASVVIEFLTFQLANQYWTPTTSADHLPFDSNIIEMIYRKEIDASGFAIRRIMMLEFSQYLENYLWPNYKTGEASKYHMLSIVVMLNEKFRERVEVWKVFEKNEIEFSGFFQQVLEECLVTKTPATPSYMREQTALLVFLNHCFNSMEVEMCRNQAKKLVSLSTWTCLQPSEFNNSRPTFHSIMPLFVF